MSSQKRTPGCRGTCAKESCKLCSGVRLFLMITSKQTHTVYTLIPDIHLRQSVTCLGVRVLFHLCWYAYWSRAPASLLHQFLIFFALWIRIKDTDTLLKKKNKTLEKPEPLGSSGCRGLQRVYLRGLEKLRLFRRLLLLLLRSIHLSKFYSPFLHMFFSFYLPCRQPTFQTVPLWNWHFSKNKKCCLITWFKLI